MRVLASAPVIAPPDCASNSARVNLDQARTVFIDKTNQHHAHSIGETAMRYAALSVLVLLGSQVASAQPMPGRQRQVELRRDRGEVARSTAQVNDDRRDLARFQATLKAFDDAVVLRNTGAVRAALSSFVQQGRAEVAEQTRETRQANREVGRSAAELNRDRNLTNWPTAGRPFAWPSGPHITRRYVADEKIELFCGATYSRGHAPQPSRVLFLCWFPGVAGTFPCGASRAPSAW